MRLHRLTLRDVKGVPERTLRFPDAGVVVIEGPNEVGKSTLLEAFDRLLDPRARATSQSRQVRALQPVGRDVGPFVEAEFSLGAYRVRFAKRWLRDPMTTLEVLAPVAAQLSGSAAQARLDTILAEALDRPLWDALRFTQAGELGQVPLTDSGVLTEALDAASGADLHAADGTHVLDRVEEEFLRYFTPTGRMTGELRAAANEWQTARDAAAQAHGRLQETEAMVELHQRLQSEHEELVGARPELLAALQRAQQQADTVSSVAAAHAKAKDALDQARERSVRASRDLDDRHTLVRDVQQAQAALTTAEQELAAADARLAQARQAAAPLEEAAAHAEAALDQARDVADRAAADADHLADLAQVATLAARAERLAGLLRERLTAVQAVRSCRVTDTSVRAIEAAAHELALLRARHEAASPTLLVESLGRQAAVLMAGSQAHTTVTPGAATEHQVLGEFTVEVPGTVRVTVRPEPGATTRAEGIAAKADALGTLLADADVPDVDQARGELARRGEAEAALRALDARITELLDGTDQAGLVSQLEALQDAVDTYRAERGSAQAALPALPADVAQARAVAGEARAALDAARTAHSGARRAHLAANAELSVLSRSVASAATTREVARDASRRLAERLAQARAAVGDDELEQLVAQRAGEFARVESVESQARRELRSCDVEGVQARLAAATRRLTEHDEATLAVHHRRLVLQGQVELTSGEGRAEAYHLGLVEVAHARTALEAVDRRARAARQLHQTLLRHRDTAHRAYVRPYAAQLDRLGQMVYGDTFAVEVGDDLTIMSRHLDGTTVPFDQLSGGAKEQLGILARLAVAALVDPTQGVPVIIDDALGYTDPDRLHRVGAVFGGPAEQAQVILLTCTPGRYAQIPHTTTICLTA